MGIAIRNGRYHTPRRKRCQDAHDGHTDVQQHEKPDPEFEGRKDRVVRIIECQGCVVIPTSHVKIAMCRQFLPQVDDFG